MSNYSLSIYWVLSFYPFLILFRKVSSSLGLPVIGTFLTVEVLISPLFTLWLLYGKVKVG